FTLGDFFPAVVAVRADVMAQVRFPRGRLDCERRGGQEIVRAMHAALRRRLLVLLDCHVLLLKRFVSVSSRPSAPADPKTASAWCLNCLSLRRRMSGAAAQSESPA